MKYKNILMINSVLVNFQFATQPSKIGGCINRKTGNQICFCSVSRQTEVRKTVSQNGTTVSLLPSHGISGRSVHQNVCRL